MAVYINKDGSNLPTFSERAGTIKRQSAFPLDAYSYFTSLEKAKEYAETNTAYIGQVLSVVENDRAKQYIIIDTKGTLQPAGGSAIKSYDYSKTRAFYIDKGVQKLHFSFTLQVGKKENIGRVSLIQFGKGVQHSYYLGTETHGNKIQGEITIKQCDDSHKFLQYKITDIVETEETTDLGEVIKNTVLGQTISGQSYFASEKGLEEFSIGNFQIQHLSPKTDAWGTFDTGVVQIEQTFSN